MMDKKKSLVGMLVICAMLLTACGIKSPTEEELLERIEGFEEENYQKKIKRL